MSDFRFDIRIAAGTRTLVDIRDFALPPNRITFLFGESGIGKSLMAKAIYGLLDPEEFRVSVNGMAYDRYLAEPSTRELQRCGFFVFQEPSSHFNPLMTLAEQVWEGDLSTGRETTPLRELWDDAALRRLLPVYPKPHRPSGGEKQKMLLAMALIKMDLQGGETGGKPLFIFDEPTGSLDNRSRDAVLSLVLRRFRMRRSTILLITHDYSMISIVQKHFPDLRDALAFREVGQAGRHLAVREFLPETYTDWVGSRRPSRGRGDGRPLLEAESGMQIFGNTLTFSSDAAGEQKTPLELRRGVTTYLKAPSGTGKTTVIKMLMGLLTGDRMRVRLGNSLLTERTPRSFWQKQIWGSVMTMAFQHADEALNLQSSVLETFAGLPLRGGWTPGKISAALGELFEEEVSGSFLSRTVGTLSGGQKQKLNLLRCLVLDTEILIFDEPLNGLDFASSVKVITMLERRQEAGKAVLLISHNEEMFDAVVDHDNIRYLHSTILNDIRRKEAAL